MKFYKLTKRTNKIPGPVVVATIENLPKIKLKPKFFSKIHPLGFTKPTTGTSFNSSDISA